MATAAQAVRRTLEDAGVDHAFTVPGESFLGLLDALDDAPGVRVVSTRHEGGAAFMAEAYAKLTRRLTVCLASRAVGAANAAIGLHTARQDSSPVLALLGQVPTDVRHREAFQEADLSLLLGEVTKWAVEPPSAERIPELVAVAAARALAGRPGPVAVSLREDLLAEPVSTGGHRVRIPAVPSPGPVAVRRTLELIRAAERPVLLLGLGARAAGASDVAVELAEAEELPVLASWRRPDVFPNDHRLYLGQTGLGAPPSVVERARAADLVVAVGCRLNAPTTFDYRVPAPAARLIHVDVDPAMLRLDAAVAILADAAQFLRALLAAARHDPGPTAGARERNQRDRSRWEAETTPVAHAARPGYAHQQAVAAHLRRLLPRHAIVTTDAGNFSGWAARYLRWHQPGTFLGPTSGAMGYAVPAALAASLARPEAPVVALAGDGGFLMTGAELETAVREGARFVTVVYDNEQYGTIRMHQMQRHPGREPATRLGPVDFAGLAASLGARGIAVTDADQFADALAESLDAPAPTVLWVRVDPEQISVASDADRPDAGDPGAEPGGA